MFVSWNSAHILICLLDVGHCRHRTWRCMCVCRCVCRVCPTVSVVSSCIVLREIFCETYKHVGVLRTRIFGVDMHGEELVVVRVCM